MTFSHNVVFDFDLALEPVAATGFVRDAALSLSRANFIENLVQSGSARTRRVRASIPVNASLFRQQSLSFESRLIFTPQGAKLEPLAPAGEPTGWAEVEGEARVTPSPGGSHVTYRFDITIHLQLPEPEKWGGKALVKMIHFTARRVLDGVIAQFPAAVQEAAREVEARYSEV